MTATAAYLVGAPRPWPEPVVCQRCGLPVSELVLVWKTTALAHRPLDGDGRRYWCPPCTATLGPLARRIPPPEQMAPCWPPLERDPF